MAAVLSILGRVLRIPCRGRLMWPFEVAGLGLRYRNIKDSDKLGHPLRNPLRTALRREDMRGLHSDWCANLTALARVRTEWANDAIVIWGSKVALSRIPCDVRGGGIGSVHRSVLLFL